MLTDFILDVPPPEVLVEDQLYGLEVETEFDSPLRLPKRNLMWLDVVPDGSLRDPAAEFIFRQPLPERLISKAMAELDAVLSMNKRSKLSWREGTHVHIDVRRWSLQKLQTVVQTFFLLEDSIIKTFAELRADNAYCRSMKGVVFQAYRPERNFALFILGGGNQHTDKVIDTGVAPLDKYTTLNLAPIFTKGSIEARVFPSSLDVDGYIRYIQVCAALANIPANMPPLEAIQSFRNVVDIDDESVKNNAILLQAVKEL